MMTERGVAVGHHRFKSAGVIYCGQQTIVPFASGHSVLGCGDLCLEIDDTCFVPVTDALPSAT